MTNRRGTGIVAAALLLLSGSAGAVTLSQGGITVFGWNEVIDGASINARAQFTLTSINATTAVFMVSVTNNSSGAGNNRLVAFGFDAITPDITAASINNLGGGLLWSASIGSNMSGGFGHIDLCIWAGVTCTGGTGGGLGEGESDTFRLTLTGPFSGGTVTFGAPYIARFQSVGRQEESYTLPGGSVPEPAPLALLAFGLSALALRRRITVS